MKALAEQRPTQGAGLRILTETVTSPTLASQIDALLKKYPQAKWHQYEPWNRDNTKAASGHDATQRLAESRYDFTAARIIVALDSDFLFTHPESLAYARQFAKGRNGVAESGDLGQATMSRLYVAEPTPTITGTMADHRLPCGAAEIRRLAVGLLDLARGGQTSASKVDGQAGAWLQAAYRDLSANRGAGLVVVGEGQPADVHRAALEINGALRNDGTSFFHHADAAAQPTQQTESLADLVHAMGAGQVDLLVQIGGNAAYNAPADFGFAAAMGKVKRNVHLGLFFNETAQRCQWHLPEAHYLESWGDACAFDGTASILQPLIMPLYEGRTVYEVLDMLVLEQSPRGAYDIVRGQWQATHPAEGFDKAWRKIIHDGLENKPAAEIDRGAGMAQGIVADASSPDAVEIVFKPDYTVWDGRFCNNGWLQETPKPVTKLMWDNAALLSPRLAERLDVHNEDVVELTFKGRSVHAPVWITPGQAENSVTLHLGYGRTAAGHVGSGQGGQRVRAAHERRDGLRHRSGNQEGARRKMGTRQRAEPPHDGRSRRLPRRHAGGVP